MSTQLREMFDASAESEFPTDLAQRAVDGAQHRRRQRFIVGGAVAAAAALVLGVVVANADLRSDAEPRPTDVASLPAELPGPSALPELTAGAVDAASTAYVIDNELVLFDSQTAEAYAFKGISETAGLDTGGLEAGALRPYQVRLSPDGSTALVAMQFESSQRLLGIHLAVLDVASAESSLEDLQLSDAYAESAWLEYNLMAWAPDSKTAYCVCLGGDGTDSELGIWAITIGDSPGGSFYTRVSNLAPSQISAGTGGLAIQVEPYGGAWELRTTWEPGTDGGYLNRGDLGPAESLALSYDAPTAFAGVTNGSFAIQDIRQRPEQIEWQRLPAGPVSSLLAYGPDYVLVSRPEDAAPGEPAPPAPLLAHVISEDAEPQLLTTFPAGTTSTSFAAALTL